MTQKNLTVLGSTGSIGRNTLDVASRYPHQYKIHALAAHSKVDLLRGQVERYRPAIAVMYDGESAERLRELLPKAIGTSVLSGADGLLEVSTAPEVDHVVAGIVGAAGLRPAYAAIDAGKEVSIANKEVMVLAGELMMRRARETGSVLLPMDSEHNAIFQCLAGGDPSEVERIILTASGGPFRDLPLEDFSRITKKQALAHPNWEMGPKITIDSATMMNKGLEVIEAHWLFDMPPERIAVLMHRQSIVHSLVEFVDGSMIAQLGLPDMRTPIACCLAHPRRLPLKLPRLNLAEVGKLEFEDISIDRYPVFSLALEAMRMGGGIPAALNGANEVTVAAYLDDAFPFNEIAAILMQTVERLKNQWENDGTPPCVRAISTVQDAIDADEYGRAIARDIVNQLTQPSGTISC